MPTIVVQGLAAVYRDDERVTDPQVLASLVPLVFDDDDAVFTDYLGGTPLQDELRSALERSGVLRFTHAPGADLLTVTVEFRSRRDLSDAELHELVKDTLGQWSDGIGESWTCISPQRTGYAIMCLSPGCGPLPSPYPIVRVQADAGPPA
jgi:hypothetical protein